MLCLSREQVHWCILDGLTSNIGVALIKRNVQIRDGEFMIRCCICIFIVTGIYHGRMWSEIGRETSNMMTSCWMKLNLHNGNQGWKHQDSRVKGNYHSFLNFLYTNQNQACSTIFVRIYVMHALEWSYHHTEEHSLKPILISSFMVHIDNSFGKFFPLP